MNPLGPRRRALSPAARVGYAVIRALLIAGLGLGTIALSVVASVWGLSAVLVAAALVGLVVVRTIQRVRAQDPASTIRPPRRVVARAAGPAFVITGVAMVGFFVLLALANQIWASH